MIETGKARYMKRLAALKSERSTWIQHWQDLAQYMLPRRFRYFQTDRNRGTKKNDSIINGTPTWAIRTLSSGMVAGFTSPARIWFRLTTQDPELAEFGIARSWLHIVEERMREVLLRSNFYKAVSQLYPDLATFGTSVMHIDEDDEDVIRCYVIPAGQYCLGNSARLAVDTLYREFSMSAAQLVEQFGLGAVSSSTRNLYEQGNYDAWVPVVHVVEPRRNRDPSKRDTRNMPYSSCWFEVAGEGDKLLRESGYLELPVCAPRWNTTAEDVYGHSPGMDVLGDARALQLYERRKAQLVDKIVNPPMVGPMALRNQRVSMLPGDITYVDAVAAGQTLRPAIELNPSALPAIQAAIREHAERVARGLYADLWLLLSQGNDDPQQTAREVAEKHEEKMLQLGPVAENIESELCRPLIDRVFSVMLRRGLIPPPPQELQGTPLRVEFSSVMADAQKLLELSGVQRLYAFAGSVAAMKPEVLDKLNVDQAIDEVASIVGVKPELVLSQDQVDQVRQQRAQQQAQAQAMQNAMAMAQNAKTLSETDTEGNNGLTSLLSGIGPVAAAQAGGVQ